MFNYTHIIDGDLSHDKLLHSQANLHKYFLHDRYVLSLLANFDLKSIECPRELIDAMLI